MLNSRLFIVAPQLAGAHWHAIGVKQIVCNTCHSGKQLV